MADAESKSNVKVREAGLVHHGLTETHLTDYTVAEVRSQALELLQDKLEPTHTCI